MNRGISKESPRCCSVLLRSRSISSGDSIGLVTSLKVRWLQMLFENIASDFIVPINHVDARWMVQHVLQANDPLELRYVFSRKQNWQHNNVLSVYNEVHVSICQWNRDVFQTAAKSQRATREQRPSAGAAYEEDAGIESSSAVGKPSARLAYVMGIWKKWFVIYGCLGRVRAWYEVFRWAFILSSHWNIEFHDSSG